MYLSRYFLPVLKENPAEATLASHRLMLRAGMIRQLSAGIYNWLPLGYAVLKNIQVVIREAMDEAGGVELLMPILQPVELWQQSGRGNYGDETLQVKDRHGHAMVYGPTNEEVMTDIFRQNVKSYKHLPLNLYQLQWKFRDEIRPRFGVMRGREFLMKDAYTFDVDEQAARRSYDTMYRTYLKIFRRLGLSVIPFAAKTGLIGGNLSHEFQVVASAGESELFYDKRFEEILSQNDPDISLMQQLYAAADDKHNPEHCPVSASDLRQTRGIEVGHIFYFGTKYSAAMGADFTDKKGENIPVHMGAHGIGVSRLVGAIIESSHDEKGIIWPEAIAPFKVGLVNVKKGDERCDAICTKIYRHFQELGIKILYDDLEESAGKKFARMDLIGIPWQVAVGPRGVVKDRVEVKKRQQGTWQEMPVHTMFEICG